MHRLSHSPRHTATFLFPRVTASRQPNAKRVSSSAASDDFEITLPAKGRRGGPKTPARRVSECFVEVNIRASRIPHPASHISHLTSRPGVKTISDTPFDITAPALTSAFCGSLFDIRHSLVWLFSGARSPTVSALSLHPHMLLGVFGTVGGWISWALARWL